MSNREDKAQRRQERVAAEEAAKKQAAQRKRLGIVGGGVLVAAVVAIVLVFVVFQDDEGGGSGSSDVIAPTQNVTNLAEAARAAGCTVSDELPDEGNGHTAESMEGKYKTNPPTSGDHDPTPSQDGIYEADQLPDLEQSVHALEHGRIAIQYKKGTDKATVDKLEAVASEEVRGDAGYHTLVYQNLTDMEPAVAAVAWRYSLTCPQANDKIYDAIRAFRIARLDKGPEFVP